MHSPEDPVDTEEAARLRREAAAKLPAELRFVFELPDFNKLDAEEVVEFSQGYLKKLRAHREQLIAARLDADKMIAQNEAILKKLGQANTKVEQLEEKWLQATADCAEAQYRLFKGMEAALPAALEENPFDPNVQQMKELVDEWRQHMPKE